MQHRRRSHRIEPSRCVEICHLSPHALRNTRSVALEDAARKQSAQHLVHLLGRRAPRCERDDGEDSSPLVPRDVVGQLDKLIPRQVPVVAQHGPEALHIERRRGLRPVPDRARRTAQLLNIV